MRLLLKSIYIPLVCLRIPNWSATRGKGRDGGNCTMTVYYRNISVSVNSTITRLTDIVADLSRDGGCAD